MYSSIEKEERLKVIKSCYWPLFKISDLGIPIGIEAPGVTLDIINEIDPKWIKRLIKYVKSGKTIPKNLKIRVSDKHLEQERNEYQDEIDALNKLPNVLCQIGTAGVSKDPSKITCISSQQDNKCFGDKKECADCWLDSNNNRQVYKEK